MGRHGIWIRTIEVIVAIPLILLLTWGIFELRQQQNSINALRTEINQVRTISIDATADQRIIDFLKDETETHRQFIDSQEQQLFWLFGIMISIGGLLLAFFGFASSKDVQDKVEKATNKFLESQDMLKMIEKVSKEYLATNIFNYDGPIDDFEEYLDNLKRTVKRERCAREIKILFAVADTDFAATNKIVVEFKELIAFFQKEGYQVPKEIVPLNKDNISEITKDDKIVVFYVPKDEHGEEKNKENFPNMLYPQLSKIVEKNKTQCVLLTSGRINQENIDDNFVTTVNFHAKLRETIYMLLYFSPLNDIS